MKGRRVRLKCAELIAVVCSGGGGAIGVGCCAGRGGNSARSW